MTVMLARPNAACCDRWSQAGHGIACLKGDQVAMAPYLRVPSNPRQSDGTPRLAEAYICLHLQDNRAFPMHTTRQPTLVPKSP